MTTERDRLVELLAEHQGNPEFSTQHCSCGIYTQHRHGGQRRHLADALIANGWSRTVQRPEVDAEVEWGVRWDDHNEAADSETHARAWASRWDENVVVSRTVGPWQEAQ